MVHFQKYGIICLTEVNFPEYQCYYRYRWSFYFRYIFFYFLFIKKRSGESNFGYSQWDLYINTFSHYFLPLWKKGLQRAIMGTATTTLGCYGYPRNSLNSHIWGWFVGHYFSFMIWVPVQLLEFQHTVRIWWPLLFLDGMGTLKTLCKYYLNTLLSNRYIS